MLRQFINPRTIAADITAGLVLGIESVPDGLAAGVLAAVNPIHGLYAYMTGTFTGALFSSSALMSVQATSAMALVVASVPSVRYGDNATGALLALSILTGILMLAAGLLKLGSMVRFVPNSVLTGFVNAVAILIILGQLPEFSGYPAEGANKIAKTFDLLRHLNQVDFPTIAVGGATILLILMLEKTSLKALGLVVALIVSSFLVPLFGWDSVALVSDIAEIPAGLPRINLPSPSAFLSLFVPAISLAFVGLVQGAAIGKTYANPDGTYPDPSGDFVGQGAANLASGLLYGMPVGGSMSATALVVGAGAKSRFANLFAGIVMAVIILALGSQVGYLAMPAVAGLLIVIGFRTLRPDQVEMVWKTGLVQQLVMGMTFVACLFFPLQYAVLMGVALSLLLFVFQQSNKITIKEWTLQGGGAIIEGPPPAVLPGKKTTLLVPFGSLFFAAAPLFEEQLPKVDETSRHAVVILNVRGHSDLGSTFLTVLDRYNATLRAQESRLMLAGISDEVIGQLIQTGLMDSIGNENVFQASEIIGASTSAAQHEAQKWIEQMSRGESPAEGVAASVE